MRRSEKRKREMKEDAGAQNVGKSRITAFFPTICGSGGSKGWLAKAAGAEPTSQMRDEKRLSFGALLEVEMSKKCAPLLREAHFQVKNYKTHQRRTTLGSSHVEKVHAVVARSIFGSQKCQKLLVLRLFRHSDVGKVHLI